jgi:hypothetical protein
MGYTYLPGLRATADVIADAKKIIDASPLTICGPKGQGLPILNETEGIRLHGLRPPARRTRRSTCAAPMNRSTRAWEPSSRPKASPRTSL